VTASAEITRRYVFHGKVQGVGFRWKTRAIAAEYPVVGHVKNLADGSVELIVFGEPVAVDSFVERLSEHFASHIVSTQVEEVTSESRPTGFSIRR